MNYRDARELARVRHQLRDRLAARSLVDVRELLQKFHAATESDGSLASEYERWNLRFQLLAATSRNAA